MAMWLNSDHTHTLQDIPRLCTAPFQAKEWCRKRAECQRWPCLHCTVHWAAINVRQFSELISYVCWLLLTACCWLSSTKLLILSHHSPLCVKIPPRARKSCSNRPWAMPRDVTLLDATVTRVNVFPTLRWWRVHIILLFSSKKESLPTVCRYLR